MTKKEGAIITAYTGYLIGDIRDFYIYVKELTGESYMTHQYADPELVNRIQALAKQDFIKIQIE